MNNANRNQAFFKAEIGDTTISPAASFVLAIYFTDSYFCDSRCPFSQIDNRKQMLGRLRSHFRQTVDVWNKRAHQGRSILCKLYLMGHRWPKVMAICGPTQLNIHFEGVSDHRDKRDLVFSGLYTFLKRRVDSVDTVQRHCWQCLLALVGVKAHQTKIPSVANITVDSRTELTPPITC
jgi:hypothetical protein